MEVLIDQSQHVLSKRYNNELEATKNKNQISLKMLNRDIAKAFEISKLLI